MISPFIKYGIQIDKHAKMVKIWNIFIIFLDRFDKWDRVTIKAKCK